MIPKRKYLAPKRRDDDIEEVYNTSKEFIEKYFPEPDKTKFLNKIEVYRLISAGLPPLEKKVEFLALKKSKSESSAIINYEKTFDNFENAIARDPTDGGIKKIIALANEIVRENKDKKRALMILQEIRRINIKILRETSRYMREQRNFSVYGAQALRKGTKDDYKKVAERVMTEQQENPQVIAKMKGMIDKQLRILQALVKNEEEYKKLLDRKKSGESVENLIKKNREYNKKLKKEDKENSEIALKWGRSEEGRKIFSKMNKIMNIARNKGELELRMTTINEKIQKNEEEYEKLLERKNKGEYVDDLIKQNRYTAEKLKNTVK
jgi:hypothetical protein